MAELSTYHLETLVWGRCNCVMHRNKAWSVHSTLLFKFFEKLDESDNLWNQLWNYIQCSLMHLWSDVIIIATTSCVLVFMYYWYISNSHKETKKKNCIKVLLLKMLIVCPKPLRIRAKNQTMSNTKVWALFMKQWYLDNC